MLYKAIPIFGIFNNIQRDHSYEVPLKFSHLIPFPLCRLQNIVRPHFLALDLIGSKTELNINTKNTITWTSFVFFTITESSRNCYVCRWLSLVRAILNFRALGF